MIGTGFLGSVSYRGLLSRYPVFVADYETLRGLNTEAMVARVTGLFGPPANGTNISGDFIRDDNDTTSADDNSSVIVASNGKRWKRIPFGFFLQAGTGAVGRTAQDKMRERISLKDFGAVLDGVTNDYAAWTTAVAALSEGDTLYIDGPFYYTTPILLTKNLNLIFAGERGYLKPNVGANDAFTFRPASARKIAMELAMYGAAGSCTNGIVLDNVTECDFSVGMAVGATSHGIRTLGCLNCNFDFDISTNRSAPSGSGAAMPAKHLYVGASIADPLKPWCNASFYKVYFGGGGQGIEGANASSQGNCTFKGTIEGNTGPAFSFTGNKGLRLQELHIESGLSTASSVTNCTDLRIDKVTCWGLTAANNMLNVVGCSAFKIDNYTGSLNIDSTSHSGSVGVVLLNANDTITNNSSSVPQVSTLTSLASSSNASGQFGNFTLENLFANPYCDIWPNGPGAAPLHWSGGGGGSTLTWTRVTTPTYGGTPGAASRVAIKADFTVAQPPLANAATAILTGQFFYFEEESWYSVTTAIYVPAGQPDVDVYIFNGGAYVSIGTVTTKDAYVVVRGAVKVASGNAPQVICRPAGIGHFYIGGLSVIRSPVPSKTISNNGQRTNYLGSVAYDPPNLVDGSGVTTTVTVTGAALGDFAEASFSLDLQGITITAYVSAVDTVSVRFQNETGGAIDLANGTLRAAVRKALA